MDERAQSKRETALLIVRRLVDAGHVAYFAGGCVRDRVMGLEPADYDVVTDARPDEVQRVFRNSYGVGEAFGVMLVRMHGYTIEVATFRSDGAYSDGRRPDEVHFSDAQHDAQRRDFTINGLFENPLTDEIIDFVGGKADIAARVIRAIGDPHARLREDRLRMLRAVRFAARLGFDIEPETAAAIREGAGQLEGVSRERIGQEIRKMLAHENRGVAAWQIQYLGLDAVTLNEANNLNAPTRVGRLPEDAAMTTAMAAWLLDRHDESGEDSIMRAASRWVAAMKLSNQEAVEIKSCLRAYLAIRGPWRSLGVAQQKRHAASGGFIEALMIVQTIDLETFVEVRRKLEELTQTGINPPPFLDGDALVRAGFAPGPAFKQVLDAVYDAQLEGGIQSGEEALDLARVIFRTQGGGGGGGGIQPN